MNQLDATGHGGLDGRLLHRRGPISLPTPGRCTTNASRVGNRRHGLAARPGHARRRSAVRGRAWRHRETGVTAAAERATGEQRRAQEADERRPGEVRSTASKTKVERCRHTASAAERQRVEARLAAGTPADAEAPALPGRRKEGGRLKTTGRARERHVGCCRWARLRGARSPPVPPRDRAPARTGRRLRRGQQPGARRFERHGRDVFLLRKPSGAALEEPRAGRHLVATDVEAREPAMAPLQGRSPTGQRPTRRRRDSSPTATVIVR